MSLINVFLSPTKALVGVDTESINGITGGFIESSKMMYLPHANVILAGRGTQGFLLMVHGLLAEVNAQDKTGLDFDGIAKALPATIKAVDSHAQSVMPAGELKGIPEGQQIVLVGWSGEAGRMRAIVHLLPAPGADIEVIEIEEPGYMLPWEDRWGAPPEGESHGAMAELAQAQTRNTKQESPETAMGGRLLLAELTRGKVSISTLCHLAPPARAEPTVGGEFTFSPTTHIFGQQHLAANRGEAHDDK